MCCDIRRHIFQREDRIIRPYPFMVKRWFFAWRPRKCLFNLTFFWGKMSGQTHAEDGVENMTSKSGKRHTFTKDGRIITHRCLSGFRDFEFSIKQQTVRRIWHNCVYEIYVAPLLGFIFRTWRFRYADPYLTKQTWKAFWTVCMLDMSRKFWLTQMIRDRWMANNSEDCRLFLNILSSFLARFECVWWHNLDFAKQIIFKQLA